MKYEISAVNLHTCQVTTKFEKFFEFEHEAVDFCHENNSDGGDFVFFISDREFM